MQVSVNKAELYFVSSLDMNRRFWGCCGSKLCHLIETEHHQCYPQAWLNGFCFLYLFSNSDEGIFCNENFALNAVSFVAELQQQRHLDVLSNSIPLLAVQLHWWFHQFRLDSGVIICMSYTCSSYLHRIKCISYIDVHQFIKMLLRPFSSRGKHGSSG